MKAGFGGRSGRRAGAKGLAIVGIFRTGADFAVIVSSLVLAAALGPEDFGFISVLLVIATGLLLFGEGGMTAVASRLTVRTPKTVRALFRRGLLTGLAAAAGGGVLLATVAVPLRPAPERVLAVAIILVVVLQAGCGGVAYGLLSAEGRFFPLGMAQVAGAFVYLVVIGICALTTLTIPLVAAAIVLRYVTSTTLAILALPRYTKVQAAEEGEIDGAAYSAWVTLSKAMGLVKMNVDYIFLAVFASGVELGRYALVFVLTTGVVFRFVPVLQQVLLPMVASASQRGDSARVSKAYCSMVEGAAVISVAWAGLIVGVFLTGVPDVFGDEWSNLRPVLLAIVGSLLFRSLDAGIDVFLTAVGRPEVLARLLFWQTAASAVIVGLIVYYTRSAVGAAVAMSAATLAAAVIAQAFTLPVLGMDPRQLLQALSGPLRLATRLLAAAAAVGLLVLLTPGREYIWWLNLIVAGALVSREVAGALPRLLGFGTVRELLGGIRS